MRHGTRRRGMLIAAGVALCVASSGCIAPIWSVVPDAPQPYPMTTIQITGRMPNGWMSSSYEPLGGVWHFTKHGDELERIYLRRWPKTTVVKGTNRSIREDMALQEIADLSLDSRRLDEGVTRLEVLSNQPTTVDDRACYRIDYRYRDGIGLPRRTVEVGCPIATWMYRFEFDAPMQHYFETQLPAFEALVESIVFQVPGA